MWRKYVVSDDDQSIVVKYHPIKKELIIGGFTRFQEFIETVVTDIFDLDITDPNYYQFNKVKYCFFEIPRKLFNSKIKTVKDLYYTDIVQNHGRLL